MVNLSPRVGLAWDVHGDGRTAVRSSYGLAYDFQTAEYHGINATAPPFGNRTLIEDPTGLFDDPYRQFGGDPHPIVTNANTEFIPYGSFGAIDPGINSPRVQSWNVTFEQQIGDDWGASISYLGSHSDRLWNEVALNPGVFLGLGPCTLQGVSYPTCTTNANLNQRRVFSLSGENPAAARRIGSLDLHTDVGIQNYRGLKLSLRRRAVAGVSVNGNYTWSRCFGDFTTGGFPQISSGYTDPANPAFDRGYCDQDRTASRRDDDWLPDADLQQRGCECDRLRLARVGNRERSLRHPAQRDRRRDRAFSGIPPSAPSGSWTIPMGRTTCALPEPRRLCTAGAGHAGQFPRNGVRGPGYWDVNVALSRVSALAPAAWNSGWRRSTCSTTSTGATRS